jgi:hypothetical protein
LHPGFSENFELDIQHFTFNQQPRPEGRGIKPLSTNKKRWAMATIMSAEIIAEYKIIYKRAVFYTNTSIAVHSKSFINNGINVIADEQIGFDAENATPISIPLEQDGANKTINREVKLKNVPVKCSVFIKNKREKYFIAMSTFILLFVLAPFVFVTSAKTTKEPEQPTIIEEVSIKYLPPALESLAKISFDVLNAKGQMLKWQYDEDVEPFIEIQTRGIDVLTINKICDQYDHAFLQEIQDIKYDAGEPLLKINMNVNRGRYTIQKAGFFFDKSSVLGLLSNLSKVLIEQGISITSEVLPTNTNGNSNYSIAYAAKGWNLIPSLKIIENVCENNLLRVKKLEISFSNNNFTVFCTLSYCNNPDYCFSEVNYNFLHVPSVFGYRESKPANIVKIEKINDQKALGSIKDGKRKVVFLRETNTGKIIAKVE